MAWEGYLSLSLQKSGLLVKCKIDWMSMRAIRELVQLKNSVLLYHLNAQQLMTALKDKEKSNGAASEAQVTTRGVQGGQDR